MYIQKFIIAAAIMFGMLSSGQAAVTSGVPVEAAAPTFLQVAELSGARRAAPQRVRLDVFSDNGLVIEFTVSCGMTGGMLTYARSEGLFCDPDMRCSTSKGAAIASICKP